MSLDLELGVTLEPIADPPRLPTGNWFQDRPKWAAQPLWAEQASEVAARLFVEHTEGFFALLVGRGPNNDKDARHKLLELSGWAAETRFHVGLAESKHPIEEGFLRRLRFWRSKVAPTHGITVPEVLQRFIGAEGTRVGEAESWLRTQLGEERPPGELYQLIDYPSFDCGSGALDFATLVHGPELHAWSRFVHHHK